MNPDEMGYIVSIESRDKLGRKTVDYKWEGPPIGRLSKWMIARGPGGGEFIEMGPWLLRVIDEQPWCDYAIVELVDHPWAWVYTLRHRARRAWEDFSYRMIHTLILWGLAKRPEPGAMVDWRLVRDKWL